MGSGKISFKGCFHDVDWGLQTHTYAPLNVDMKCNYRIEGCQDSGLYLKEEIEIECNRTMISFVKKEMKAASKVLVDRLIKKAELLDAGVLQAMIKDGRLKTFNPADRTDISQSDISRSNSIMSQPSSLRYSMNGPMSPVRMGSVSSGSGSVMNSSMQLPMYRRESDVGMPVELPGNYYYPQQQSTSNKYREVAELDSGVRLPPQQPDKGYRAELSSMPESADEYTGNIAHEMYRPYRSV
ncbi:hypothetical protein N7495_008284 [Penicillium taxi]|uniref:uncharacterized protein n=1 Tax=Penicillium taxi TaxID=168475 RepID=UPI0025453213|nr:uncharacterized protein N7495_008284 [Penicillium taxi]KAJ5888243.1 hypothetical protein N7495_008284 [Penicillium taxi]